MMWFARFEMALDVTTRALYTASVVFLWLCILLLFVLVGWRDIAIILNGVYVLIAWVSLGMSAIRHRRENKASAEQIAVLRDEIRHVNFAHTNDLRDYARRSNAMHTEIALLRIDAQMQPTAKMARVGAKGEG